MQEGMSPTPALRRPAALVRALVVAGALAVAAPAVVLAVPGAASAQEPAGTDVVGRLVQAWPEKAPGEEDAHDEAATPLSWVETGEGAVRVPTEDVAGVPAGATVELTLGADVRDEGTEEHGLEPAQRVLETGSVTPPRTATAVRRAVTNQVTVVLVAPAGTTPDTEVTVADVAAVVDGPVADFWSTQTDGAIRFGVARSSDWISTTAGCADPTALWDEAAAAVGFRPGPGKHLMLHLSSATADQPGCSYALAEVGAGPSSGGRSYVRDTLPSVIAHELGHNLGLSHSSGRQCDGSLETGTCRTTGYRDYYDVMGVSWRQLGSLTAPQAAVLGVLPAAATRSLDADGEPAEVTLAPLGTRTGIRALRLTDAGGIAYWLEYRTATGADAWLGGAATNPYGLESGVLLRREAEFPDTSLLLDGTPSAFSRWDDDLQAALPVGVPVVLAGGDFTVTLRSATAGGAALDVVPAGAPPAPVPAAPRESGAGRVLAGGGGSSAPAMTASGAASGADVPAAGTGAGEPAGAAPWVPAPPTPVAAGTPALEPASGSTPTGTLLVAVAGAGLAGTTLLAVRRVRRSRIR
jgi:hypothetical protein